MDGLTTNPAASRDNVRGRPFVCTPLRVIDSPAQFVIRTSVPPGWLCVVVLLGVAAAAVFAMQPWKETGFLRGFEIGMLLLMFIVIIPSTLGLMAWVRHRIPRVLLCCDKSAGVIALWDDDVRLDVSQVACFGVLTQSVRDMAEPTGYGYGNFTRLILVTCDGDCHTVLWTGKRRANRLAHRASAASGIPYDRCHTTQRPA